ncbi:4'-phosphopantetheinyl transferase family protein [Clostridium rectalis]|uniref:4'-phosphopantetheinyl transferase family protein n=1 Tax=Clostridium rectalis TaxID=2040295 RepID=UPI000F641480|nr:4'-phosphopantetheinyl transferase superfamily protein [Clostridium rectalis]
MKYMLDTVLYIDDIELIKYEYLQPLIKIFSPSVKERINFYYQKQDKKLSTLGYLLLHYMVYSQYKKSEKIIIETGVNGRPVLKNYPNIDVNISHCKNCVACCISLDSIGIDVQDFDAFEAQCIDIACHKNELHILQNISNKEEVKRLFIKYWTLKESTVKRSGEGISDLITDLNFSFVDKAGNEFVSNDLKYSVSDHNDYFISGCSTRSFLQFKKISMLHLIKEIRRVLD